jgi:two-component system sensor histidine kinase/response regulator
MFFHSALREAALEEVKTDILLDDDAGTCQKLIMELTQRDEWLRILVEQCPVSISISLNGITLFVNRAFLQLFGYNSLSEIIGTPQLTRVAPESRETVAEHIQNRALGEEVPSGYEITGLRKDGVAIPLYIVVARMRLMDVPVSVVLFMEVSEKRKVEEALQASETRFRNLVESINDYIAEVDLNGRVTYASPRVYNLIGYLPEEVFGKSPFDFMEPEEAARVSKIFLSTVQKEEPFRSLEHILVRRDGTRVIAEASGNPFFDEHGRLLGYRVITHEIMNRKQAEVALAAAEKKYRNIFENAVEGIFQTLPDGSILDVNPAMARILGFESAREMKEAVRDVGLQIYQESGIRSQTLRALENDGFGSFEFKVRRKDGTTGWIFINTRVVRDSAFHVKWRRRLELNQNKRFCRPLP